MKLNGDSLKPIYVQIAEWLEAEILRGSLKEDERIYSQYQLAELFNINPATAAKGLNILAEKEIAYKKRGLGMFVSPNAREFILGERKNLVLRKMIEDLILEARRLGVHENNLFDMIHKALVEIKED